MSDSSQTNGSSQKDSIAVNALNNINIPDLASNEDKIKLDPSNKMPLTPEQDKLYASQKTDLSSARNYSTIPRASIPSKEASACPVKSHSETPASSIKDLSESTDKTPDSNENDQVWVYPSEQMFYNALKRKNYKVEESDMKSIVPIHNAVNEMCWKKILEWESIHKK
ncbi:putative cytochrome c1 heme lyase [Smittium mucronatum]|uniref:Holocytochrome c-type synthase n=1 Tax=Smittium mucronatum TaxID=133383 RepID=A0A1R0GXG3_9FUNG|nr:putative cytochrome c1 heme lyase [Smittium mucronatum]